MPREAETYCCGFPVLSVIRISGTGVTELTAPDPQE